MTDTENKNTGNVFSPLEEEGLRGDGQAKWYVVHTYSGYEKNVRDNISNMVENRGMQDLILDIKIPMEKVNEVKDGKLVSRKRKMFPGYVIIKMIVNNETWYLVRNTQGVTGFVGHGSDPIPLTQDEVRRMHLEDEENYALDADLKLDAEVGEIIKVISGPFESFEGKILKIDNLKKTLEVSITMFGRETSVELEFPQVEKL